MTRRSGRRPGSPDTQEAILVEPVASAPPGQLIAAIGPTVQRYLTGALPDDLPDDS